MIGRSRLRTKSIPSLLENDDSSLKVLLHKMVKNNVWYSSKLIVQAILIIAVFSSKVESTSVTVQPQKSNVNLNSESSEHTIEDLSKIGRLMDLDFWWIERGNRKGAGSLNERRGVVFAHTMPGKTNILNDKRHERGSEFANEDALVAHNDKTSKWRKRHAVKRGQGRIVSDRKIKEKDNEKGNEQNKESDNKNEDDNNDKNIKSGNGQPWRRAREGIVSHIKISGEDNGKEQRQDRGFNSEMGDVNDSNRNTNGANNHNWRRAMAKLKILEWKGRSRSNFGKRAVHEETKGNVNDLMLSGMNARMHKNGTALAKDIDLMMEGEHSVE